MKNLYPKGKGKIHPSPSLRSSSSSSLPSGGALAVLNLLPAAILALTVVLGLEDKEVLAYLVTRSLKGPCSVVPEEKRRCRRQQGTGLHKPLFDCGCFDCYTSFWFRWDSSPDRELIHQVIEAFEEHLASSEKSVAGRGGRRRDRRRLGERSEKKKKKHEESVIDEGVEGRRSTACGEKLPDVATAAVVEDRGEPTDEKGVGSEAEAEAEPEMNGIGMEMVVAVQQQQLTAGCGERRKAWPDVMGLFNLRLWSLWSPGV